jgi:hypothetical protein
MKVEICLLFITLLVFLFVGNQQISNFSFISKNKNNIEVNNFVVVNKNQNKIQFKDIKDNSMRINKLCIHDTRTDKVNCLNKEDLALAKESPDLRNSMVCLGDSCISELHAGVLNGSNYTHIKTDPLGKTSMEVNTFHAHPGTNHSTWNWHLHYTGNIPESRPTNKNKSKSGFWNQLFKLEGIDREPSGDPIAFGAGLGSQVEIPINSVVKTQQDRPGDSSLF